MLPLELTPTGVLLPIQVKPKASRNGLAGVHAGRLKVAVTAAPEKGRANAALLEVLADALGLKRSQLSLVAGETDPRKTVLVTGITPEDLHARLADALGT
jgi:uncharacterized protein (TIGR00251 family)